MKKKIFLFLAVLIVLVGIGTGAYFYLNQMESTAFNAKEQQWLEKNKNNVVDFYMPSDIAGLTYMGKGVFFDFLNGLSKKTGLTFNATAYKVLNDVEDKIYSIELVDEIEDNQILMFKDNYVMITFNNEMYTSIDDIESLKIGILAENEKDIRKYLTGANIEYVLFDNIDELSTALSTNDGSINGIIGLRSLFLDELLVNNLHIAYHIDEMEKNYVLTLNGEDTLNSIIKKYYNSWDSNLEISYNTNLLDTYFDYKGVTEKERTSLREKAYVYAFINNGAYDTIKNGKLNGINYSVIKSFAEFANVDMEYRNEYSSITELVSAYNNGEIDFFFGNNSSEYAIETYETSAPIKAQAVILSSISYTNNVNSIYSLQDKKVNVISGSKIEKHLKDEGIRVVSHNSIKDLIKELKSNSIVAMDLENYEYYKIEELAYFKVDYILSLNNNYNYVINGKNKVFAELFNFYLEYVSVELLINSGYKNVFSVSSKELYLTVAVVVLSFIVLAQFLYNAKKVITFIRKRKRKTLTKDEKIRYIDALTSLKNRAYLNANIEKWDASEVYPQIIIIIDLNNVAYINDNFGHEEGDKVITEAANILIQTQLSKTDILRTDGNEFLIYMVEHDEKQAVAYIRKLNKEFKELSHGFGAAVGYSVINDGIKTIDDAINEATLDMRTNKEAMTEE
jgi:diguanylate cyclase (GGDEF)-like protein